MSITLWLDQKYINLLSAQLPRVKKSGHNYNFRCIYCGDSDKNKYKSRAYLIYKDGGYFFYCHNCHASKSFKYFLKEQNGDLYRSYLMEMITEQKASEPPKKDFTPKFSRNIFSDCQKISDLSHDHLAHQFLTYRCIPAKHFHLFYLVPEFLAFTNKIIPDKFENIESDHPRIVIPFYENNRVVGYSGRIYLPHQSHKKYITIKIEEESALFFTKDSTNFINNHTFVCEGAFDSLFIDNCIAVGSSALGKAKGLGLKDYTLIYDNEPHNRDVGELIKNSIRHNEKVVIWPMDFRYKDINEAVMNGVDIQKIIRENRYAGLKAMLKFNEWKKYE